MSSDAARELTPDGIKKFRQNAHIVSQTGMSADEIWASPLVRARQTADLLAEALSPRPPVRVVEALEPEHDPAEVAELLEAHQDRTALALVGHEPDMGTLATFLLTGLKTHALRFKKGGIACIEAASFRPPLQNHLRWLLTPRQMRSLE